MSTGGLSRQADIRKLAAARTSLNGRFTVAELARAAQVLADQAGTIAYAVEVAYNADRVPLISGHMAGDVQLVCQRCLEPMTYSLHTDFAMGVVYSDEQAKQLPRSLDPIVSEDGEINLLQVLEDELLLSLPAVSYHPADSCPVMQDYSTEAASAVPAEAATKDNPFQVLQQLKTPES